MDVHEKLKQKSASPPNVVDSSPLTMEKNRECNIKILFNYGTQEECVSNYIFSIENQTYGETIGKPARGARNSTT